MVNWQQQLVGAFIPGASAAYAITETVIKAAKIILFLIVLILSIVSLAGASKSKSTGKGKGVLALSVFIFLMTLGIFIISKSGSNTKAVLYFIIYFILALMATIIQYQNIDTLGDDEEKKQAKNSARSTTGIVVLVGIYLLGAVWAFKFAHDGIRSSAPEIYFLN